MVDSLKIVESGSLSNKRQANLDLLRWICSVFVIFEHFCERSGHNAFGFAEQTSMVGYLLLQLLYPIARVAVPVFFILSGYLSVKSTSQKLGKVINLFVMTIAFSYISYFAWMFGAIYNGVFSFSIKDFLYLLLAKNYYLYLYCGIYALSPYINRALTVLTKKQFKTLLIICFLLFSVWSTIVNTFYGYYGDNVPGVNFIGVSTTDKGFTIVNFTMLYLFGCYLRLYYKQNKKRDIMLSVCSIVGNAILLMIFNVWITKLATAINYYDSFFIIISSLMMVVLFLNINIKSNRIISYLGTCAYGVFLIHGFSNSLVEHFIAVEAIVSRGLGGIFLGMIIFVFGVYIISLLITSLMKIISNPFNNWWEKTRVYNITFFKES